MMVQVRWASLWEMGLSSSCTFLLALMTQQMARATRCQDGDAVLVLAAGDGVEGVVG